MLGVAGASGFLGEVSFLGVVQGQATTINFSAIQPMDDTVHGRHAQWVTQLCSTPPVPHHLSHSLSLCSTPPVPHSHVQASQMCITAAVVSASEAKAGIGRVAGLPHAPSSGREVLFDALRSHWGPGIAVVAVEVGAGRGLML